MMWVIIHYKTIGWSNKKIAREVGKSYNRPSLNHTIVKAVWMKYSEIQSVENQWNKAGRPSMMELEQIEEAKEFFYRNPNKSVNEARNALNIEASRPTINRHILEHGLRAYRAPKKIYISSQNVENRFDWAKKMENKGLNYWRTVIFTDESSFALVNPNGRLFLRRNSTLDFEGQIQHKAQTKTLMVWGDFLSRNRPIS